MPFVDGVIGNSSSGILEVPSFKKGTINIGDRQRGRTQARSVINCEPSQQDILKAIKILYSKKFAEKLHHAHNPYGPEGASDKIVNIIRNRNFDDSVKKSFYDIKFSQNIGKIN
jgi:GDP/UDP-N,N'-diacetylbacillosamine 2-epimerase (hydrolysing)